MWLNHVSALSVISHRWPLRSLFILLLLISACLFGQAAFFYLKGMLAQQLMQQAWLSAQKGNDQARPWAWADFWPLARLRWPDGNIDLFVVSDASSRHLAFGPGFVSSSAQPGSRGYTIISAHRDSHFDFIGELSQGDEIHLELARGEKRMYSVFAKQVINITRQYSTGECLVDCLVLSTCYPLDALNPETPLRLLVFLRHAPNVSRTLTLDQYHGIANPVHL